MFGMIDSEQEGRIRRGIDKTTDADVVEYIVKYSNYSNSTVSNSIATDTCSIATMVVVLQYGS